MLVTLDMMEYATDAAAQAAYVSSDKDFKYENETPWTYPDGGAQRGLAFDGTYYYVGIGSVGVRVYDLDGNLIKTIPASGAPTHLGHGVATDGTYIWTSDYGTNRKVYQYRVSDSQLITSWVVPMGGDPVSLAYDGTNLWIVVYGVTTVYKVNTSGTLLDSFGVTTGDGTIRVACDAQGYILVSDLVNDKLRRYKPDGTLLNTYDFILIPSRICTKHGNRGAGIYLDAGSHIQFHKTILECFSESGIKEQGSYSLRGVALVTDSLNDTLTRTVSPTIDLSDHTKIKFYIRSSRIGSNIKIGIRDSGGVVTEITPNIVEADTWLTVEWDISGVSNDNKDAIDRIQIKIIEASVDNIFYLDNMFGGWPALTLTESLGLLENLPGLDRSYPVLEESLALLEDLTQYERGLPLEESIALKEEETASISSLLTESLALKESLPILERGLTLEEALALLETLPSLDRELSPLEESLALLEDLSILERGLTLEESLALLESETVAIQAVFTENLALREDLTQLGRALTLEESLALLEEAHAETLLFKVDKDGNIIIPSLKDAGDAYAYIDSEGKLHRGAGYP